MTLWHYVRMMFSSHHNRTEVVGAPPSLKDFEKMTIRRAQEDMTRTLQILELEADVVERK